MLKRLIVSEQRKRFNMVIDYLTALGYSKKAIATTLEINPYDLSNLQSGKLINISDSILNILEKEYDINPDFVRMGASNMLNMTKIKFNFFEGFVNSWDIVEHERDTYVHITMDENFYRFLINLYKYMEVSENKNDKEEQRILQEAFKNAYKSLKKNPSEEKLKDYVIIPADNVIEIAESNIAIRKSLNEVVNILNISAPKQQ